MHAGKQVPLMWRGKFKEFHNISFDYFNSNRSHNEKSCSIHILFMNTCSFVNIIKNFNELDLSFYSFESSEIRSGRLMHHSPIEINVTVKYFQNVEIPSNR